MMPGVDGNPRVRSRAVLFDVDGVLLDSYAGYQLVWSQWCLLRAVDFNLTWAATHGRRPTETIAEVAPHLNPHEEYLVLAGMLAEVEDQLELFPAAHRLLPNLTHEVWGLVTSGRRGTVVRRLTAAGLPVPMVVIDGDDVAVGKPDPSCYLAGAARLGVPPGRCLVVEDAPAGIAAGKAAGMCVLAVATTHPLGDLVLADQCVRSLDDAVGWIEAWLHAEAD